VKLSRSSKVSQYDMSTTNVLTDSPQQKLVIAHFSLAHLTSFL